MLKRSWKIGFSILSFALLKMVTLMLFAAGCAPAKNGSSGSENSELIEILKAVPLSEDLKINNQFLNYCNEQKALGVLSQNMQLTQSNADEVWESCQQVYACSPTTRKNLALWFESKMSFRIGFLNLKGLQVQNTDLPLAENTEGVYWTGTPNVYLDTSLKKGNQICVILLHELTHRFDQSYMTDTLETEYKAYHQQTSFKDELYLHEGPLGQSIKMSMQQGNYVYGKYPFYTKLSLLSEVATAYNVVNDASIAQSYSKLPREIEKESMNMTHHRGRFGPQVITWR